MIIPMMIPMMIQSTRECLQKHSRSLHASLCGIFCTNSVVVARYDALIRTKSPTNCDAHLAESLFQTRSRESEKKDYEANNEKNFDSSVNFDHGGGGSSGSGRNSAVFSNEKNTHSVSGKNQQKLFLSEDIYGGI